MDRRRIEPARLRRDVEGALGASLDVTRILPLLHRLARTASEGSDDGVFAHRQLAELLAERSPWRASLHAKRVVAARPEDDRGWAALGFCQTLLGNYRFAATSYERALENAPGNAWYAHNLGHLLDVALCRPEQAVPWLLRAHEERPRSAEIISSLSHALARSGDLARAKELLCRALARRSSREHEMLLAWVERGAPKDVPGAFSALGAEEPAHRTRKTRSEERLSAELDRGLRRLPLDAKQRARAHSIARDVASDRGRHVGPEPRGLAAAIAYAVVEQVGLPLSLAEVSACFRVGNRTVRGHLSSLRTRLLRLERAR